METVQVFISSTSVDLKDHRAVARNVVLEVQARPEMMETFGASSLRIIDECRARIEKCDLMILIVAHRKGWTPTSEQGGDGIDSVTAWELRFAREKKIPVLAFLADDGWPGKLWEESTEDRAWVKKFRDQLNLPADFFAHEEPTMDERSRFAGFRNKVKSALLAHQQKTAKVSQPPPGNLAYLESTHRALREGLAIPFLGTGLSEDAPLSSGKLAHALSAGNETSLATAAEYCERYSTSRADFLLQLRKIIERQQAEAPPCIAHDMLAGLKRPPLIVSACLDLRLEERLMALGHPVAVVTHIIRSSDSRFDGLILVLRRGEQPVMCPADKLSLRDDEWVVYKPLGSPLLHTGLDPDHEIDTVVITETDHLTFLGRLEHQHTQIPARFARPFQRSPLLFMGYALDVWHYRLVMQVFHSIGRRGTQAMTLAVRRSTAGIEELAWQRLDAKRVATDLEEFARSVMTAAAGDAA